MITAAEYDRKMKESLDRQAIREVLIRYCRGLDRRDAELISSVYHPGASDTHFGTDNQGQPKQAPVADIGHWFISEQDYGRSLHFISNETIEIDGDVAGGETYFHAYDWTDESEGMVVRHSYGRYADRFERRDGEWKIARRMVILEEQIIEHLARPLRKGVRSLLTRDDPSYPALMRRE